MNDIGIIFKAKLLTIIYAEDLQHYKYTIANLLTIDNEHCYVYFTSKRFKTGYDCVKKHRGKQKKLCQLMDKAFGCYILGSVIKTI